MKYLILGLVAISLGLICFAVVAVHSRQAFGDDCRAANGIPIQSYRGGPSICLDKSAVIELP